MCNEKIAYNQTWPCTQYVMGGGGGGGGESCSFCLSLIGDQQEIQCPVWHWQHQSPPPPPPHPFLHISLKHCKRQCWQAWQMVEKSGSGTQWSQICRYYVNSKTKRFQSITPCFCTVHCRTFYSVDRRVSNHLADIASTWLPWSCNWG